MYLLLKQNFNNKTKDFFCQLLYYVTNRRVVYCVYHTLKKIQTSAHTEFLVFLS
jgi:hypothetical protein